jgi:protein TonB
VTPVARPDVAAPIVRPAPQAQPVAQPQPRVEPHPEVRAEPRPQPDVVAVAPPIARAEPRPEAVRPAPGAAPVPQQPRVEPRAEPAAPQPRQEIRPEPRAPDQRHEARPEVAAPAAPVVAQSRPPSAAPTGAPAPAAPAPPAPRSAPVEEGTGIDENPILEGYLIDLQRALGKSVSERDYPRLARERGWEGKTYVMLTFGRDGLLKAVALSKTSGYPILDDKALELVKRMRVPPMPGRLRKIERTITMPVNFVLKGKH